MNETLKNIMSLLIKSASIAMSCKYPEYTLFATVAETAAESLITFIPTKAKLSTKKLTEYIFQTISEIYEKAPIDNTCFNITKDELKKLNKDELGKYIGELSFDFNDNEEDNLVFSLHFTQLLLSKAQKDQISFNYLVNIYITNFEKEITELLSKHQELENDLELIKTHINKRKTERSVQVISKDSNRPKSTYVNRSEIIQLIEKIEKNDDYIIIRGIGGIGKTELCKKVFWEHLNNKCSNGIKYLAWINYAFDLQSSLLQAFPEYIDTAKSNEDCVDNLCKYLNSLGTSLLLFIDNANKTLVEDNSMSIVRRLACRIIITTRVDIFCEQEAFRLGEMNDEECKTLFEKNFRYEIPKNKTIYVDKLIELCARHTLTIELLAKTANNYEEGIEGLYNHLVASNFKIPILSSKIPFEEYESTVIEHLEKLFSLVKISNTNKNILLRLSVLPYDRYEYCELLNWKIANNSEQFIVLITLGWLNSEFNGSVSIHPIIAQVISNVVKITYRKFQRTIEAITAELEIDQSTYYYSLFRTAIVAEFLSFSLNFKTELFSEYLSNVAVVLSKAEERSRAIELYNRAIEIKKAIGASNASLSSTYNNMSIALRYDLEKSLYYSYKSLELEQKMFEEQPNIQAEHYATTLNNYGLSNMNMAEVNSHEKYHCIAEKSFIEALRIRQNYNLNKHGFSQIQNNMGLMYSKAGDLYKGLIMHIMAVKDESSPNVAIHKYNLGKAILYIYKNEYSNKSIELIKQIGLKNLEESLSHFRVNEEMNLSRIERVIIQLEECYRVLGDFENLRRISDLKIQLNIE